MINNIGKLARSSAAFSAAFLLQAHSAFANEPFDAQNQARALLHPPVARHVVSVESGEILRNAAQAKPGTIIEARLAQGRVRAKVEGTS